MTRHAFSLVLLPNVTACHVGSSELSPDEVRDRYTQAVCSYVSECRGVAYDSCERDLAGSLAARQRVNGWPGSVSEDEMGDCESFVDDLTCDDTDVSIAHSPACSFLP